MSKKQGLWVHTGKLPLGLRLSRSSRNVAGLRRPGEGGLAEFYSVLTRAPFTPRLHPAEAGAFLDDNILPYFELVAFSVSDYGVAFDALHLHGAQKAGYDRVRTFNVKKFRAMAPPAILPRLKPDASNRPSYPRPGPYP
jgi:hypothetical protein